MRCPNCQSEEHDILLIDCTLVGEARKRRFCFSCRPEADHPFSGSFPRCIMASNLPDEEKQKALAARRYAPDYRAVYSIAERIIDLVGPIVGRSN